MPAIVIERYVCRARILPRFLRHYSTAVVILLNFREKKVKPPNSYLVISPAFTSLSSVSESRYRARKMSDVNSTLVPSDLISSNSATKSVSGTSIAIHATSLI